MEVSFGTAGQYNDYMDRKVNATDAKAHLLALLDDVTEGEVVEITRHGRTIARLVPALGPRSLRGSFAGAATTAADDEGLFATGAAWDLG